VASYFVNQIKEQAGFFPFLSFYGAPQTGKSHLTRTLNAIQCLDAEGIPMRKTNTPKGELRKIAQHSGVFVALLEWPSEGTQVRFDLDNILTLYNVNPLQVRARTSNDSQTVEMPFCGSLMFVQNVEPFKTKPQKERVVSCKFTTDELTPASLEALRKLEEMPLADKASFFVEVMGNRLVFESNWLSEYRMACTELAGLNLTSRLCENHGLVLAFHRVLCRVLGIDHDLLPYVSEIAQKKQVECATNPDTVADHFLEQIIELSHEKLADDFADLEEKLLWVHKVGAEKAIKEHGYSLNCSEKELMAALQAHPAYLGSKAHRFGSKGKKAHIFDLGILFQGIGAEDPEETVSAKAA
jgi:hypothetical protein